MTLVDRPKRWFRTTVAVRDPPEAIAGDNPGVMRFQNELAECYHNIANVLNDTGHPQEAVESYRQAVAIRERLLHDNPTQTRLQSNLAGSHFSIGNLLSDAGRESEALASYRLAQEIQDRLVRDNPTVNEYQNSLGATCNNIGVVLKDTGHLAEALESYRRALEIHERLAHNNLSVHSYQDSLAIALHNIAEAEMGQRRWHDARLHLDRAIARQRAALAALPHNSLYQRALKLHLFNLMRVYWALNQPSDARQVTRELAALTRGKGADLHKFACALALSVPIAPAEQRQTLAAEAVQTLKQAIAAGWSDGGKTSRDPDLASLHDRDDFRRLLAELFDRGFPADPFAR